MIRTSYPLAVTSRVNEISPPFIPRGVIISNYSADNLAFDNTVDPVLLIPPGVTVPIVISHLVSTLRIRSATNTTGYATVVVMDSEPDTTNAPNLQQLPGTITATIPSAIGVTQSGATPWTTTDATAQGLLTAISNLIGTTNTNTGGTVTGVANLATLITASNILDTDIRTLITVLTGLLPASTTPYTLAPGAQADITLAHAVPGFGITSTCPGFGRLNVWVTGSGQTVYLVRDQPFSNGPSSANPVEKRSTTPVAAGDQLHIRWDDATVNSTHIVRV